MGKQYPSDELVNTIFKLFVKDGYPMHYDFPEYMEFIDSVVNFKGIPEFYDKYNKCKLFALIPEEQREYILTENEKYIKAMIKEHTIDEDIFNLNYFNHTHRLDEFFLNKKISNKEKKELIGLHSISILTPIDSTIKSVKDLSKKEIFDWLELTPIEHIYEYANKWKNNKYLTSVLKEYNEEIFELAKKCERYVEFAGLLFINYDYVSADFNYPTGKFRVLTGGLQLYNKLKNSEFWYEYNIPGEKRDFYSRVQELRNGTEKEKALYYEIKEHFSELNTWRDLQCASSRIQDELQNVYPKEKILEILKKISENTEISEEEKQMYSEFFKGIDYIYYYHNSQTFVRPQEPYFYAIAETDEFKSFSSHASYDNIYNYLNKANIKIQQKDIEEER